MGKPQTIKLDGIEYIMVEDVKQMPELGDRVLVRCRNAGIHVGTQVKRDANVLVLENANRIWRWRGAHDLNDVAMQGVNRKEYTRISRMVPSITLTVQDVCEVIPVAKGVDLTECGDRPNGN